MDLKTDGVVDRWTSRQMDK
jgi:hypothetical protein